MKSITRKIPALFIGMALTTCGFAALPQADFYPNSCSSIARHMHEFINENAESPCAGDLDIAAAYVEAAGMSLHYEKVAQAIKSLDYAVRELGEISYSRTHCAMLAPRVKYILAGVVRARGELEAWERMRLSNKTAS